MEVQPGIHVIADRIDATTLTVTLVAVEDEALVVDTGLPATPEDVIFPYLRRLDRPAEWIRTIVNTHCHADHSGGNGALLARTDARLLIHASEVAYLADQVAFATMLQERFGDGHRVPPPDPEVVRRQYGASTHADAGLEHGDQIVVGDRTWEVVHTPGHSVGGICLYEQATGTLITGDAIQAEGTTSTDLAFYFDADDYELALERVAGLEVEIVIAGHPFRPFTSAVHEGAEARRFLDVSRTAYTRYRTQVPEILRAASRPLTAAEVAAELTARNGVASCAPPATYTARAHLEQLRREGRAVRIYAGGTWRWSLGSFG